MMGWVPADGDYAKSAMPGWRDRDWSRYEYDVTVAGRRLHYLDVGTGDRVFVLIHGMGGSAIAGRVLCDLLSEERSGPAVSSKSSTAMFRRSLAGCWY